MIFTRLTNDDGMKIKERTFFPLFLHVLEKRKKLRRVKKRKFRKKKKRESMYRPGCEKEGNILQTKQTGARKGGMKHRCFLFF